MLGISTAGVDYTDILARYMVALQQHYLSLSTPEPLPLPLPDLQIPVPVLFDCHHMVHVVMKAQNNISK